MTPHEAFQQLYLVSAKYRANAGKHRPDTWQAPIGWNSNIFCHPGNLSRTLGWNLLRSCFEMFPSGHGMRRDCAIRVCTFFLYSFHILHDYRVIECGTTRGMCSWLAQGRAQWCDQRFGIRYILYNTYYRRATHKIWRHVTFVCFPLLQDVKNMKALPLKSGYIV